nr:hypothetical protein [Tanacetum cinerariifolium]
MSHCEKSSESFDSSNLSEYDEWEARFIQRNLQTDEIISELLINMPEMIIRDRPHTTRRRYCDPEREMGEKRLMQDYFVDRPTYDEATFWNRFRMRRPLFLRIVDAVTGNDVYFQQRRDCTGRKGLSPLQKCTGAMRVLAYGTSADAQDEYLRMSETVTRNALTNFVAGVISCFGQEYLRKPNENDLARLLLVGEEYYNMAYYLTDGIYPSWAAFVKLITSPQLRKHKLFAQQQEAVRKDVERAFGVLQARFAFLRHPCLVWDKEMMGKVTSACIIIYNMIVEDERDTYLHYYDPSEFLNSSTEVDEHAKFSMERIADLSQYMTNRAQLRNRETHNVLKNDLIEHPHTPNQITTTNRFKVAMGILSIMGISVLELKVGVSMVEGRNYEFERAMLVLRLFYLAEAKTELSHNRVGSWVLQRELTIKNLLDVLITMIAGSLRNVSVPTSKTLNSAQKGCQLDQCCIIGIGEAFVGSMPLLLNLYYFIGSSVPSALTLEKPPISLGGVSQQVRQVLKKEAGKCINCRSPADLVDTNNVLKLFFVPVYRWPGKQQLMHCNNCNVFFPPSLSPVSSGISDNLRCRFCDREVHSDFRFCPFCGSAL